MKVFVVMMREASLLGGCRWEVREYIKGIYSDKVNAESIVKKLQNDYGVNYYDYEISYYVEEWEVE